MFNLEVIFVGDRGETFVKENYLKKPKGGNQFPPLGLSKFPLMLY
jgi:hypothetical protein